MRILIFAFFISSAAFASSPSQENRCSGVSVFETAKTIFHKNPMSHAEAAIIAGSTEKGREYSEKLFNECVGKGKK